MLQTLVVLCLLGVSVTNAAEDPFNRGINCREDWDCRKQTCDDKFLVSRCVKGGPHPPGVVLPYPNARHCQCTLAHVNRQQVATGGHAEESTFDCRVRGPSRWNNEKREHCCEKENIGCGRWYSCSDSPTSPTWNNKKKDWCCKQKQIFCQGPGDREVQYVTTAEWKYEPARMTDEDSAAALDKACDTTSPGSRAAYAEQIIAGIQKLPPMSTFKGMPLFPKCQGARCYGGPRPSFISGHSRSCVVAKQDLLVAPVQDAPAVAPNPIAGPARSRPHVVGMAFPAIPVYFPPSEINKRVTPLVTVYPGGRQPPLARVYINSGGHTVRAEPKDQVLFGPTRRNLLQDKTVQLEADQHAAKVSTYDNKVHESEEVEQWPLHFAEFEQNCDKFPKTYAICVVDAD